jgi:DNA polymerase III psi subunit
LALAGFMLRKYNIPENSQIGQETKKSLSTVQAPSIWIILKEQEKTDVEKMELLRKILQAGKLDLDTDVFLCNELEVNTLFSVSERTNQTIWLFGLEPKDLGFKVEMNTDGFSLLDSRNPNQKSFIIFSPSLTQMQENKDLKAYVWKQMQTTILQ